MDFIGEIVFQIVILMTFGLLTTYAIWKIKKRKTADFGEFLNKYGEMLAYASIIFIGLTIAIIQTFME